MFFTTTVVIQVARCAIFFVTEIEIWAGFGLVLGRLAILKKIESFFHGQIFIKKKTL